MARTESFRRQHRDLSQLATEIALRLTPEEIERDPGELRRMIARFAGKLRVHSRMENEALYPELLRHPAPEVRATAERLFADLGAIYGTFDVFEARWPDAASLAREPRAFVIATLELFETLRRRITLENRTLYPMVDALGE